MPHTKWAVLPWITATHPCNCFLNQVTMVTNLEDVNDSEHLVAYHHLWHWLMAILSPARSPFWINTTDAVCCLATVTIFSMLAWICFIFRHKNYELECNEIYIFHRGNKRGTRKTDRFYNSFCTCLIVYTNIYNINWTLMYWMNLHEWPT